MWPFFKGILKNPLYRFLLSASVFYVVWYTLYELWIHPAGKLDIWVVSHTMNSALVVLKWLGYRTFSSSARLIGIDGTPGLWMGDNCDSVELFAIFAGFIIAFPGHWKHKLWYVPSGIVLIFFLNAIRVTALAVIQKNWPDWLEFNHTYTFTILVYGFIFGLWLLWINKIAKRGNILKSKPDQ